MNTVSQNIECPKCGAEIPVTEALAGPIIAVERARIENEVRERSAALENREKQLSKAQSELEKRRKGIESRAADLEELVRSRLESERSTLLAAESKRIEAEFQQKLDTARREYRAQAAKVAELEKTELEFRKRSAALAEQERQLELTITRQLDQERDRIRHQAIEDEQGRNQIALAERERVVKELQARLAQSQKAELDVRRDRERLEDEKRALDLEVTRRIDAERRAIREATQKEDDERHHLRVAEKDKVIEDMRKQVEELRRKSEQGSQQLQGEVQELRLESALRDHFPRDEFEAVEVGRNGADLLQRVVGPGGAFCGTILWECKRTRTWQEAWLTKLRDDQRAVRASLCAIVSTALPKEIESFDRVDDVWVTGFPCLLPVASALRFTLIQTHTLHLATQNREDKTGRMYSYITGHEFKQRVSGIVEGLVSLRANLEREKRSVTAAWAKREKCQDLIMVGVAGLYGDLHGILGKALAEVDGLEAPLLVAATSELGDSPPG